MKVKIKGLRLFTDCSKMKCENGRETIDVITMFWNWDSNINEGNNIRLPEEIYRLDEISESVAIRNVKKYIKMNIDYLFKAYKELENNNFCDWVALEGIKLGDYESDYRPDLSTIPAEENEGDFLGSLDYGETKKSLYDKLCKYAIKKDYWQCGELL